MQFRWIEWNLAKAASHGVTRPDVEHVVEHARPPYPRYRADGRLLVWGRAASGQILQVVFLLDPDDTVFVIHARPLTDREKQRWRRDQRRRGSR